MYLECQSHLPSSLFVCDGSFQEEQALYLSKLGLPFPLAIIARLGGLALSIAGSAIGNSNSTLVKSRMNYPVPPRRDRDRSTRVYSVDPHVGSCPT